MICRVTAYLLAPVAAVYPLHLDAVLAAAAVDGGHHLQRGSMERDIIDPPIPVARINALGARCHLSTSWIWPEDATRGQERCCVRKDAEDIELRAGPWSYKAGPEKARNLPIPTMESATVSWLVVGGRQGLKSAVRYVQAVGPYRRQGYGVVDRWEIDELKDVEPVRVLIDPSGRAARHLPERWAIGESEWGAYESPYWHPARTSQRRISAGTPCVLREDVLRALMGVK